MTTTKSEGDDGAGAPTPAPPRHNKGLLPLHTTSRLTASNLRPGAQRLPPQQLTVYAAALVVLAFFAIFVTSSVTSISSLTSARKLHTTWLHPSHPSHRSPFFDANPFATTPTDGNAQRDSTQDAASDSQQALKTPTFNTSYFQPLKYTGPFLQPPETNFTRLPPPLTIKCPNAAIVTIGFSIPSVVDHITNLTNWCVIIVPSSATSPVAQTALLQYSNTSVVYLDMKTASNLPYTTAKSLNSYRTLDDTTPDLVTLNNIAYLLAVHQGAENILDIWHDVTLDSPTAITNLMAILDSDNAMPLADAAYHLFNPHPFFRPVSALSTHAQPHSWPRGFPLRQVPYPLTRIANVSGNTIPANRVAALGSLLNFQADVDATLATTTDQLPLVFQRRAASLALPAQRFAPLSSACLLWRKPSFATLFLPPHTPVRILDILRGYVAQRALHAADLHAAFTSPVGRRAAGAAVAWGGGEVEYDAHVSPVFDGIGFMLRNWQIKTNVMKGVAPTLASVLQQLYVTMMQMRVVPHEDVASATVWLKDLRTILPQHEMFTKVIDAERDGDAVSSTATHGGAVGEGAGGVRMMSSRVGDARRVPNVAVCVTGRAEGLLETVSQERVQHASRVRGMHRTFALDNVTGGGDLYRNILSKLGAPDVFIVTGGRGLEGEEGKGKREALCDSVQMPGGGGLWRLACSVVGEEGVSGRLSGGGNGTMWGRLMEKWWNGLEGGRGDTLARHLKQMEVCHEAIGRHTAKTGKVFDWIVSVRGDAHAISFANLETLTLREEAPTVWVAGRKGGKDEGGKYGGCCCGDVGGGVAVGSARVMATYLQQYAYLQAVWGSRGGAGGGADADVRAFAEELLTARGVVVREHDDIRVCRGKGTVGS